MAPAANAQAKRKRTRKRKRRAASSSSSSSSSSDSSDDEVTQPVAKVIPKPAPQTESSSSESSESSDSQSSSSEEEEGDSKIVEPAPRGRQVDKATSQAPRRFSPSPSPPPTDLPSFLPSRKAGETSARQEQELKDRFRKFWMASVAEGFKDDLEEIRKEPNLTTSRLGLLIDSLASGADVFSRSSDNTTVNEMEVVL
ncbi:hypothetical protein CPB84DRAFT_1781952, partial [Gymnopilus junonius]